MTPIPLIGPLWRYRGFVASSVLREFHGRYRESLFGGFWAVANPLAMIVIYTVIFGQLIRPTLAGHESTPYAFAIYLCAGQLPWSLFAEMLARMTGVFVDNGNLLKKVSFPKVCLPAIAVASSALNFAIVFTIYLAFLALIGHWPGWPLLALVPLLAMQVLFTVGLGALLGVVNVFFRDVGQLVGIVLQFWFWLTPIVYTFSSLPPSAQAVLRLNPMEPLIQGYQAIFLDRAWPDLSAALPTAGLALLLAGLGIWFFQQRQAELVDEL